MNANGDCGLWLGEPIQVVWRDLPTTVDAIGVARLLDEQQPDNK